MCHYKRLSTYLNESNANYDTLYCSKMTLRFSEPPAQLIKVVQLKKQFFLSFIRRVKPQTRTSDIMCGLLPYTIFGVY